MHGCLRCRDTGVESCFECLGAGRVRCGCGGVLSCPKCQGTNRRDCPECCGTGRRQCQLCRGSAAGHPGGRAPAGREHLRLVELPSEESPETA